MKGAAKKSSGAKRLKRWMRPLGVEVFGCAERCKSAKMLKVSADEGCGEEIKRCKSAEKVKVSADEGCGEEIKRCKTAKMLKASVG